MPEPHSFASLEIDGTFGVVTSTHWLATAVGMGILERGGNAFDSAVATAFTLQVVEPHLNGPAGEAPILVYRSSTDEIEVIAGQGPAPARATREHFYSLDLEYVPGSGVLPACVPGAFDALMLLLERHGTMSLRDVLEPAIGYARNGFPVVPRLAASIESVADHFLQEWPSSNAIYLPSGKPPPVGSLLTNLALARTYENIVKEAERVASDRERQVAHARRVWSHGFVAEGIHNFVANQPITDLTGMSYQGLLTADDMAKWQATVEAPAIYDYGEYRVAKCGPWSQGPVLLQMLALLDSLLPDTGDRVDASSAEVIHLMVECAKLAFADRDMYYGDPTFVDVPLDVLLSREYNDLRRGLIGPDASMELRPGEIEGFGKMLVPVSLEAPAPAGTGEPTFSSISAKGQARSDTVHFDVIDKHGNMASATPSGGWCSSSPVIADLGFPLGTRGQMFTLDRDHPSALAPGKRPRTTLSPSLALRDGSPYLAFGTPGGDNQDQWALQFFLRHVRGGEGIQEAIDAPTWHTEHLVSSFWPRGANLGNLTIEGRESQEVVDDLRRRGHVVAKGGRLAGGRMTAAAQEGKHRRAAASRRWAQAHATGR